MEGAMEQMQQESCTQNDSSDDGNNKPEPMLEFFDVWLDEFFHEFARLYL